jgi:hypothetical protein
MRATTVHQSFVPPTSIAIPLLPIDRDATVAAEALLGLISEATADVEFVQEEGYTNDELIVGLIDSLSIGDSDDESMEDPAGDATDGNGADGDKADGD